MKNNLKVNPLHMEGHEAGPSVTIEVDRSAFQYNFEVVGGPLGFLQQLIENSDDALATEILLTVDDRQRIIVVHDNGWGMGPKGRPSFGSLGKSLKVNPKAKGKYGHGAKSVFGVAERMIVTDRSKQDGDLSKVVVWDFTVEQALDRYARVTDSPLETVIMPAPSDFPTTGARIEIQDFKKYRFPSAEVVLNRLGEFLTPFTAEKVRVNGQKLPTREIVGERLKRDFVVEGLGLIAVDLYVPKRRRPEADKLRIGARGPVCLFDDFLEGITDSFQRKLIPPCFLSPNLCGIIDVEVFDTYSSVSRHSFDGRLYGSYEMRKFISFLEEQLAPMVEKIMGKSSGMEQTERQQKALEDVVQIFHEAFGLPEALTGKPRPIPPTLVNLVPNIRRVEMVIGDSQEFYIAKFNAGSGKFTWDASSSGGTLDATEGQRVVYIAGSTPGDYVLQVHDVDYPQISTTIEIVLVAQRQFMLSRRAITLLRAESVKLRACNTEITSGQLKWATDLGVKVQPTTGDEVILTAGSLDGAYEVVCVDNKMPTIRATCIVTVVETKPARGQPQLPNEREIMVEDKTYILDTEQIPGASEMSTLSRESGRVFINFDHPTVTKADVDGAATLRHLIVGQVVLQHIRVINADATAEEVLSRLGELMGKILRVEPAE